ncbi:radical SAM family heme chaperone HemW [Belliella sp. DSM 111904]|uniref:Heme chaperone HemW n=1 Tax=Belliella filtrata TaxID=2923435 RepID=A0ABS9V039_9BACT|nr:radical SAM family heme chaperone HemW [Belliella filtrata]
MYIHIPFCKQACHYCDFHFSTNLSYMDDMVNVINSELVQRADYLPISQPIHTIYFGGGTPSLLSTRQLESILNTITKHYRLEISELTVETNPDDLKRDKLRDLKSLGFDRLSIGIQSFQEEILKFYNRAHNAQESIKAIGLAKEAGFEKLSIDLIYGFPSKNHEIWEKDLTIALSQDPGHISSYCLTVEPQTALGSWVEKGKFEPASDDFAATQFEMMLEKLTASGYIQYEISNFGKEGEFAVHNTNYWMGVPYLGIGPSAHSFDGRSRGANVASNHAYIRGIKSGAPIFTTEEMSTEDLVNEFIMTGLRTIWGVDLGLLIQEFQIDLLAMKSSMIDQLRSEQMIEKKDQSIVLTGKGRLLADSIASALFI